MTRRRVVAVVTDSIYPFHNGGKEIRYHEVLRRLARSADVQVYTMKWWTGARERSRDGVTYHAISRKVPLYTKGRRSLVQAAWFAAACLPLVTKPFDVIEADHIPYAPVYTLRLVTWLRRRRLVVTWHEVWGEEAWVAYLGPLGRLAWLVERGAMRLPDEIIAASAQTAERLAAELGARANIRVAPNGLDLELINRATPDPRRTDIVFVGRLLSHKGVSTLIEAVALLARRGDPRTCRVIGQGPELPSLRERARQLGVQHLVEFRDDVTEQSQLYSLLKAAEVFAFPSVREGFGIAVLEALACGLPVVTTNHPDNLARWLIDSEEKGIVCEPTAAAFAEAIERVRTGRPTALAGHWPEGAVLVQQERESPDLSVYDWDFVAGTVADALGVTHG